MIGTARDSASPLTTSPTVRLHWPDIARRWGLVGPPLRPSPEDVAFCVAMLDRWASEHGAPRALILGVTPELHDLPWPAGTDLVAADHTHAMIDAVWPGPRDTAYCAEWTALPFEAGSRDLALCDGGMHLLPPHSHQLFVRSLQRVLVPGGLFILRLLTPPQSQEDVDDVLDDLLAGSIANPNVLKLRLGMALQGSSAQGVELGAVWNALARVAPDLPALARKLDWPLEPLLAIETYRDSPTRYHFLTVAEVTQRFCSGSNGFSVEAIHVPGYVLGDRCPTVVLRREPVAAAGRSHALSIYQG